MKFHLAAQVFRNLRQVFLIVRREDDLEDTGAMCRQQLLLETADGQHLAPQGDLTGHRDIATHRNLAERAGNCGSDGNTRRWAILRDRTLRHVHMNVNIAIEVALQSKLLPARTHERHGRVRRLLHHVAKFTGQDRLAALAFDDRNLGGEDRATDFGPRQAGNDANFTAVMNLAVAELHYAQVFVDVFRRQRNRVLVAFLHYLARDLTANVADLALQVADAG